MSKKEATDMSMVNLIAKGTTIKGEVQSSGDFRIDGILNGSIKASGKVVVGSTGKVDGEITCQNAEIEGELKVKIIVKELLSLKSNSKLRGEIITNKLSIEPGAIMTGNCNMDGDLTKPVEKPKA
ncbi:MAG TPA: polymer-forming cytoskeletal protein [Bacteroidales bacterium]|nr:polymer-forming cytoskeletal protein [Bacteroidales bacterium]